MTTDNRLLKHFLAGLAYRTQKAVQGMPETFADFQAAPGVRTPRQLVHHMSGVLAFAMGRFNGVNSWIVPMESFEDELDRFHRILEELGEVLDSNPPYNETSPTRLLQGPLSDAMTHAGQLAMLRRLSGSPVPPENFHAANISTDNVSRDQPPAKSPDPIWTDADGNVQS